MLDRIQLKRQAKEITRTARVSAYLFTLLYLVIGNALQLIDTYLSGSVVLYLRAYLPELPVPEFLLRASNIPGTVTLFVSVMVMLLVAVLNAGCVLYHLGVHRGEEMGYTTLFDGFAFVGKVILLDLAVAVSIWLWSMLFVIPGIIAAYRLRFAVHNLCENPEIGVMEAMSLSTLQTKGHKMDLFVLDLTFLGWQLLCVLTLGVANIWVAPYMQQTNVGYFQQLKKMKGVGWFPPQDDGGSAGAKDPFDPEF